MGSGLSSGNSSPEGQLDLRSVLEEECEKPLDGSDIMKAPLQEVIRMRYRLREIYVNFRNNWFEYDDDEDDGNDNGSDDVDANADEALPMQDTTTTLKDGTKVTRLAGGGKRQVTVDGTITLVDKEGNKTQTFSNGNILEIFADGTRCSKKADGTRIIVRPDGSRNQTSKDGTVIETKADGTRIQKKGDVTIIVKLDGTKEQQNAKTGVTIYTYVDGTVVHKKPDGQKLVVFKDGRKVQWNVNGTIIEMMPDKRKIQTKRDGSRIESWPTGRRIETHPGGKVVEVLPDGTRKISSLVNYRNTQCNKCHSVVQVPLGQFVLSCPLCWNVILAHKSAVIGRAGSTCLESSPSPEDHDRDVRMIFDRFDADNSGSVSKGEVDALLRELNFPHDAVQSLFTSTCAGDNDGEIQWDDFTCFYNKLQRKMQETSRVPEIEITKQHLEKQQAELNVQRELLRHSSSQSSAELVDTIKSEFTARSEQLRAVTESARERTRELYEAKRRMRKRKKKRKVRGPEIAP